MKKLKILYGDIIIIAAVVLLSFSLFLLPFFNKADLKAEIYLEGELYESIELSEVSEGYRLKAGECELLVGKGSVCFVSSPCKDKLCISRGNLKLAGDTMACLPERVAVILKSQKEMPHGITY